LAAVSEAASVPWSPPAGVGGGRLDARVASDAEDRVSIIERDAHPLASSSAQVPGRLFPELLEELAAVTTACRCEGGRAGQSSGTWLRARPAKTS
jgi:hypothetical protein